MSKSLEIMILLGMVVLAIIGAWSVLTGNNLGIG